MATVSSEGWVRLGERIRLERSSRWRHRADFARATGISVRTLADLETGARPTISDDTLTVIESALSWSHGTCRRVVAGGRVSYDVDPLLRRIMDVWPRLPKAVKRLLVKLAEEGADDKD